MKTRILTAIAILFTGVYTVTAQIKVASNNNVGIGTDNPASKLSIGDVGNTYSKAYIFNSNTGYYQRALQIYQAKGTSTWLYGLCTSIEYGSSPSISIGIFGSAYRGATATTSGQSCGVYGQAGNATSGFNCAVQGELLGSNYGTAILGRAPGWGGVAFNDFYAGYFRGKVKIEGELWLNSSQVIASDINLKKDIQNLETGNIEKIQSLQAIKYKLKSPFELDYKSKPGMDTISQAVVQKELDDPKYKEEHIGLSAQDIQKVYPELVKTDNDGNLGVDYTGMIPILLEAIKEQQVKIEELEKQVAKLTGTKPK